MTTLVEASKSKKAAQTKGSKAYDDLRQLRITLMRREREIGLLRVANPNPNPSPNPNPNPSLTLTRWKA